MAQMREILNRKKAAQKIRKITRAMAMIAGAHLQKLRKRALESRPYAEGLREMAAHLRANVGDLRHPLLREATVKNSTNRIALLVITSNRGLVGACNANVLHLAAEFARQQEVGGKAVELYVAGKKGVSYFRVHKRPLAQQCDELGDMPTLAKVEKTAALLMSRFTSEQVDSVHVAYTRFISAGEHQPKLLTLLPAVTPAIAVSRNGHEILTPAGSRTITYDVSPHPNTLLAELLPLMVKTTLFECFLNAATSENAARHVAMMRATYNADQMSKALTLRYTRARQDKITNGLMDIVRTAEAFRK